MGRLFWKILLGFWFTLVTVAVLVGSTFYFSSHVPGYHEVGVGRYAAPIVTAASSSLQYGGMPGLQSLLSHWPPFVRDQLRVIDQHGQDVLGRPVKRTALTEARRLRSDPEAAHAKESVQEVEAPDHQRYLIFVLSNTPPPLLHGPPLHLLIWIALGGLAFSAALAWYLVRPLKILSEAFARVAEGKLETRVGPSMGTRRDEITDLGSDFDRMAERLKTLVSSQQQLLHDVSHELRSPLGRLQMAVGLARKQPNRIDGTLDRIELEASRLDQLVGEILTISRLEAGNNQHWDEYFDLLELVDSIVSDARFEAENAGVQIVLELEGNEDEAIMHGRAELIHRALENIVRNALKFSSSGQTITVNFRRDPSRRNVVLRIMDQGPGVPQEELASMFEPFVRLAEGRTGSGYGLGLAIAQRAVTAHQGRIEASNLPHGGLCLTVTLPLHDM